MALPFLHLLVGNSAILLTHKAIIEHEDLSDRVKALQAELAEIAEHNRQYFSKRNHSANERAQHEVWIARVYEIRAELSGLMKRTAA